MTNSVIIADNSSSVAASIAEVFRAEGYTILGVFNDGLSALRCARETPPSVVTLDLILPRLSGLQLAESLGRLPAPPLMIAISAVTARPRITQAKNAGVRFYILKPLALDKLSKILSVTASEEASQRAVG